MGRAPGVRTGNCAPHNFAWMSTLFAQEPVKEKKEPKDDESGKAGFVAPVLIFASLALGRPMTLVFEPLELMVLALSTAIFAYISLDGESHWLEGVLLLALYLMTAAVFFLDPVGTAA